MNRFHRRLFYSQLFNSLLHLPFTEMDLFSLVHLLLAEDARDVRNTIYV